MKTVVRQRTGGSNPSSSAFLPYSMELLTEEYLRTFVPERFILDERYRKGHINILSPKEGTRILGMHTPEMKAVAKQLSRSADWRRQLDVWKARNPLTGREGLTHEERMIWGLVIDYVKVPLEDRLGMIDEFIPAVDNWAICDNFCCNAKWVEKEDKEKIWTFLCGLIDSREEFRARVGLILALAHFLDGSHLERTLDYACGRGYLDSDPYYIRMGAAWLFAEGLCRRYEMTLPFFAGRRLGRWIHNKALQKARESWRVPEERKQALQGMKL